MKLTKRHVIILIILVTEVLGFSLILPFLPFYAQQMGASQTTVGLLLTTFSLFQFIAAPIAGRLSDIYGRKPLLIISQLSTLISFIILGAANHLWMLFASRIIDGLLGSNGTIASAYLSDISNKEDRSKAFGISGVAFGLGFMVGPIIGGTLSQFSYSVPAYLAAAMALVSIILTVFFLPETVVNPQLEKFKVTIIDIDQFKKYWNQPHIRQQLIEFSTYALAQVLFTSNIALYAQSKMGLDAQKIGIGLTVVGAISVVTRGILLPKLIELFKERHLERVGVSSLIVGLLIAALANNWPILLLSIVFFAVGSGLTRPLMMGDVSRSVDEREQGSVMGITGSINSLSHIIGPVLGAFMLSQLFKESYILLALTIMSVGLFLLFKEEKKY